MHGPRPERVRKIMEEEGCGELQAYRWAQMQDHTHRELRRNPRAFDHRFDA